MKKTAKQLTRRRRDSGKLTAKRSKAKARSSGKAGDGTRKKKASLRPPQIAGIPDALAGLAVPIAQLHADPANARRHPERNIEAIKLSLERFGQQAPVVYVVGCKGTRHVIKGNGVLAAAKELHWAYLAAVESGLKQREVMAFAIADNRTGELSDWDEKLLASQLAELGGSDEDLASLGFTADEIAEFSAPAAADVAEGKTDHREELAELERKYLSHPPAFTWVLIGIATVRYHEINDQIEQINAVSGVVIKTGVSDERKED